MNDEFEFYTIDPRTALAEQAEIRALLARCGLGYDEGIDVFVICRSERRLIACAGLECNIVKCVAIEPQFRGGSLGCKLLGEVLALTQERGHWHLFLYTRPENERFFGGCGFHPVVRVPGQVTLMENTPVGIGSYCRQLAAKKKPGARIGSIVMNANPFTIGHQYLVQQAARACDWLHVFVVGEDASFISYRDRFALVDSCISGLPRVTLHAGSQYMISRATFSAYFFKEKGLVGDCCTAVDLLLFRQYIAPALGITQRFVGTEPFCPTTRKYNTDMHHWLQDVESAAAPGVEVVEIPRLSRLGQPVSASEVRRLLRQRDFYRLEALVPQETFDLLLGKYQTDRLPPMDAVA